MDGIWPVHELRAAEQQVLAQVPDGALMAIAARAVTVQAAAMLGFSYGAKVLLLVGSGDNGGDALFAGAELAARGMAVSAVLAAPDRVHVQGLQAFRRAYGRIVATPTAVSADLIIDGLVGIGSSGALRPAAAALVELARNSSAPVLAIDLPSGVDPDRGTVEGVAIRATRTVTMGALKPGLVLADGRRHAGQIVVVDLGLGTYLAPAALNRLSEADLSSLLRTPTASDDKYSRGVVGVVAGSEQYPGAAELAVAAARLGGVGAVRYAGSAATAVVARWPETLVIKDVQDAGRVQAWVIGPGLGSTEDAVEALDFVLSQDVPVVVDADGLTLLGKRPSLLAGRRAPTVLTPHAGEFSRLFPAAAIGLDTNRLSAVRAAAAGSGATVLLKGDATIVCRPDGTGYVNPTGCPALATAGSGDVLSGLIGSLLATGLEAAEAAATGAYLHGLAGEGAAQDGPITAMDLIPELRSIIERAHGSLNRRV